MTFVSYAQNFEDVLLWRALRSVEQGFYIDAGAWHPDTDSVTRAFYDRGWRGINVEPSGEGFRRMEAARPADTNLQLALGAAAGTATFYALEGSLSGLSTLDAAVVPGYVARGWTVRETTVRTETLAEICRLHAPAEIHFLKIDVEGAERAVLEGADFRSHRPWIVLLEATEPMSQAPNHAGWEDLLLAAEYRFVWFDGLNRFYVPAERHDALAPFFAAPPNVFDDFIRAADSEWARRIERAETRAELDGRRAAIAELRAGAGEERTAFLNVELVRRGIELARLRALSVEEVARLGALSGEVDRQSARAEHAEAWLQAMRTSSSWRVTGPLRRVLRLASRGGSPGAEAPAAAAAAPVAALATARQAAHGRSGIRAVHQFHSGSAFGDAITNAMLLTRAVLRGLGYDSRIFVEHRDPGFTAPFHLLDDLPTHGDYVLIVRHSMGHDALGRILALPVRKIMIYHNITPPELLEGAPFLQRYARLGREQLELIRPAVAASLADSDYNTFELLQRGFSPVSTCSLLFDIDAIRGRAVGHERVEDGIFTVLFVGRIAESKGQRELLEAFALFRQHYGRPCRLMMVGRHGADAYTGALFAQVHTLGLGNGEVEIPGVVSDAELDRAYAGADLYVSASRHEGFGVPLIEAMARDIPVLACANGAVPFTVGDGAVLMVDSAPSSIAQHMLALAGDFAQRRELVRRATARLSRFELSRQVPVLQAALVQAGALPTAAPGLQAALAANMRFTIAGHVNGSYSLAVVNRALARTLEGERPGTVRLIPVEGDVTAEIEGVPKDRLLTTLLARPGFDTSPEVVISQHYPVWVPREGGDVTLAHFFWEESLVPATTIATLNDNFAGVLAPSRSVAKALIDSGLSIPVCLLPQAPDLEAFRAMRDCREPRPDGAPFTFVHVSSCFPRKGVDVLLAAWARAFGPDDAVRLVIKGFPNPHNTVAADLAALRSTHAALAPIELIDRDLGPEALLELYRQADAVVLPTRGEGYNLPAAEALAAGVKLIVTGWGGHMDQLDGAPAGAVRMLAYTLAPSGSHLATPFSLWAEPDVDDLVAALREAPGQTRQPTSTQLPLPQPWSPPRAEVAAPLAEFAAHLLLAPPPLPLTIGWVTSWDVACGVAEYSRQLLEAIPAPATIFADRRTEASAPGAAVTVHPVWMAGDPSTLPSLESAILRADPAIVVIQHQPGLLNWAMLAGLLSSPALSARVVCVTQHNPNALLEIVEAERAGILDALAGASRVVVHTLADVNRLAALGLVQNVTLIAQGAAAPLDGVAAPAVPEAPLIGCYGFFLPGKGIPELIEALAIVRRRWPAARLRLVNAEYPNILSAAEIASCRESVIRLGLGDAVAFETEFSSHEQSAALLQGCDLVVLPYQGSKEASSAALRSAMAAGPAVAVTPLAIFDEAAGAIIRLPGITAGEIAAGIERALEDVEGRARTVAAARAWLQERSWPEVGRRWAGMLEGLLASRVLTR